MQKNKSHSELVQELNFSEKINIGGGAILQTILLGLAINVAWDIVLNPSESWAIYKEAYRNA